MRRILIVLAAAFVANCSKPTSVKEIDGKIRGKASLRLSDGSTISRDDSDEYKPQIVTLSDGYLVIAFGSDRACGSCGAGTHNIFVAKSLTPYNGLELPFFNTPQPLKGSGTPVDDPGRINFAMVPNGTGIKIYFNWYSQSNQIWKADLTDPTVPDVTFGSITNTAHVDNTVVGANAAGDRLVTIDFNGTSYVVNPDIDMSANPYGFGLDNVDSAFQVRQEVSGFDDAYIASYYGSSFATTGSFPMGPIIDLDFSIIGSGLYLSTMGAMYSSDAYGDLALFSAYDDLSEDMYVITSHTARDLWNLVGYFGSDVFLPPPPTPDHFYTFETCGADVGMSGGWNGSCTGVTPTTFSFDGTNYGPFTFAGNSNVNLGTQDVGVNSAFTFSAWIYVPTAAAASCGSTCTLLANSASGASTPGFRFYVDATQMQLTLETYGAGPGATAQSMPSVLLADNWHHVTVSVNDPGGYAYIYVDGGMVNSTFAVETGLTTNNTLFIGSMNASNYFEGYIDNAKIFLYELGPQEVLADFLAF